MEGHTINPKSLECLVYLYGISNYKTVPQQELLKKGMLGDCLDLVDIHLVNLKIEKNDIEDKHFYSITDRGREYIHEVIESAREILDNYKK